MACRILALPPGVEPGPSVVTSQSPNHWIAREFPDSLLVLTDCRECKSAWPRVLVPSLHGPAMERGPAQKTN